MASVPFYLLAVLVTPALAATTGGAAALLAERSVQRRRGTTLSTIITESGRRVLVIWPGTLLAHLPVGAAWHTMALVLAAAAMETMDFVTCPLVLAPLSGEPPLAIICSVAREAYLVEAWQYLLGLLGAVAVEQDFWTLIVLAAPTVLLYQAFRALNQAKEAQQAAERAQAAAKQAQHIAEEAVQVRDTFLLSSSHDLRTPLSAVLGRAEMLQTLLISNDPVDRAKVLSHVQALRRAAKRMHASVEELTDVAHLQMGQEISLQHSDVDFGVLVQEAARTVAAAYGGQPAMIDVYVPATAAVLYADGIRLTRVLENLIGNAVKYSLEATPVEVTVEATRHLVTLTVRDWGIGIDPADLPHVFTQFYRAATATGFPGSGLGLAGAKRIVEQHGGHITLESAPGLGTTVVVTLPLAHREADVPSLA
jgi:signal transduction histidine kinase